MNWLATLLWYLRHHSIGYPISSLRDLRIIAFHHVDVVLELYEPVERGLELVFAAAAVQEIAPGSLLEHNFRSAHLARVRLNRFT